VSFPLWAPVYVKVALPVESVAALPVVAFGPVTVNCTVAPEIGVAVAPVPFFSKAAKVCVVPVTSGPAKGVQAHMRHWPS
jgi:hypothetical protein